MPSKILYCDYIKDDSQSTILITKITSGLWFCICDTLTLFPLEQFDFLSLKYFLLTTEKLLYQINISFISSCWQTCMFRCHYIRLYPYK